MTFSNHPINSVFYKPFSIFFLISFNIHIKISKNLSAKHYQENKKDYKKRPSKIWKSFLKRKRKNLRICSWTMHKSTRKRKTKAVEYRKNIMKSEKCLIIIIKNYYFWKNKDLERFFDGEYKDFLKNQFWC